MKKVHTLEIIAVTFLFIILLYFSLPYFLNTQLAKKISLLQQETQSVVDNIENQLKLKNNNTFELRELKTISNGYRYSVEDRIYGRDGFNIFMYEFTILEPEKTDVNEIYIIMLESNKSRRTGFKEYTTIAISNTPFGEPLPYSNITKLDEEMREYFIEEQKKGRIDLNPIIEYLQSKTYNVSNGLTSHGFIMSYQYTKIPYESSF